MALRIVLVDDHRILRDGLRLVLQREPDLTVVGEASTVSEALECARRTQPDLVVMDVHLPDGNGIDAARNILAERPQTRILVLSGDPEINQVHEALQTGVSGYLLKDNASEELVRAVRTIQDNKVYLCPAVSTALVQDLRSHPRPALAPEQPALSERELQVLKLVAEGLRNKEMAVRLRVSTKSIETYRSRLMTKLGCSSTAELVRYAVREGHATL